MRVAASTGPCLQPWLHLWCSKCNGFTPSHDVTLYECRSTPRRVRRREWGGRHGVASARKAACAKVEEARVETAPGRAVRLGREALAHVRARARRNEANVHIAVRRNPGLCICGRADVAAHALRLVARVNVAPVVALVVGVSTCGREVRAALAERV